MVVHGFESANGVISHFRRVEPGDVVATGIAVCGVGHGDAPDRDERYALNGNVGSHGAAVDNFQTPQVRIRTSSTPTPPKGITSASP